MREDAQPSGELCALWQSDRPHTLRFTPEQLERHAARVERRVRVAMGVIYAACAIEIVAFAIFFFQSRDTLRSAGAGLTVLGFAFLALQTQRLAVRLRAQSRALLTEPAVVFFRGFLGQIRSFSRGRWFWPRFVAVFVGPALFAYGDVHRRARGIADFSTVYVFVGLAVLAIVLNVVVAVRIIDRRLARLDRFAQDE